MKTSFVTISALFLGPLVAAAPLKAKREDVVWVTDVQVVTTVVEMTTTIWVDQLPAPTPANTPAGLFFESKEQPKPAASTTAVTTSSSSTSTKPTTSSTPAAVVPDVPAVQPTTTQPAQTTPAAPTTSSPAAAPSSGSGSSSSGTVYTGDLTYYDPNGGYGSCGSTIQNSDDVVAIPVGQMDAVSSLSNGHPWCGKKVAIEFNGQTFYATAADKCGGCKNGDLDLTSGLFKKVTGGAVDGRGKGLAKWSFVN